LLLLLLLLVVNILLVISKSKLTFRSNSQLCMLRFIHDDQNSQSAKGVVHAK
jgi:hypothetical protein